MSDETVRVRRSDMLREAIRAEKRRMLARVSGESGPQRERLLREIAAANDHGFHTSQLIDYTIGPNPDTLDDRNSPPEKFALAFSTADVVILGWRLGYLATKLCENELATVRILPKRPEDVDRFKSFVASIKITPIEK